MDFSEFKEKLKNKQKDIPSPNITNTNTARNKTNQNQYIDNSKKNIKKVKGKTENIMDFNNFKKQKNLKFNQK